MKARIFLRLTLALCLAAITVCASAQTTIPAQDDTWTTTSGTQVDFSNFGNINLGQLLGSPPTSSVVTFNGVPLNSSLGLADTLLSRGSATVSSSFSATLSLKALHLASSPDITLQDGRVYHIDVTLATQDGGGEMDLTSTSSDGGTFNSSFVVTPIFTLTNVYDSSEAAHTINCLTDTQYSCSFPMHGSGNWLLTSSSGFDPQSQGIPTVPSGVQIGNYTTVGRARYGGIQAGCGGTRAAGYHCGQQDQNAEAEGFMGEAAGHHTKPPNDCASSGSSPSPSPSPSPTPIGTKTVSSATVIPKTGTASTTLIDQQQLSTICATTQ